jgi:hypothetical protein
MAKNTRNREKWARGERNRVHEGKVDERGLKVRESERSRLEGTKNQRNGEK